MKSFKQFKKIREQSEQSIEQGVIDKSGVPNVVVLTPSDEERQLQQNKEDSSLEEQVRMAKWQQDASQNSHLGQTLTEQSWKLEKADKISKSDKEHLNRYTRSSNTLNSDLYLRHVNGYSKNPRSVPTKFAEEHHDIESLDQAVHKPLAHDLHVHTGVRFDPGKVAAQHPEGHIHLPAYTSTSLSRVVANQFSDSGHILHIHMKAGDHGRFIRKVSKFPHEHEMLLPRNTTLKVHPVPDKVEEEGGNTVHVWHAHIISQLHPDEMKPK